MVTVVGQKVRGGSYNRRDAGRALGRFRDDIGRGAYRYLIIDNQLIHAAMELLEGFKVALRTLDALHAAAVIQYRCDLLTGDRRMTRTAKQLGITTTYVPSRAALNRGVSAVDALINTLGLSSTLDHRKWGERGSRESRVLECLRELDPDHGGLWYHAPSQTVVRVTSDGDYFHGKVLK